MHIRIRNWSLGIDEKTIVWAGLLIGLESFLLLSYFTLTQSQITSLRKVLYPFVWINVSIWVFAKTRTHEVENKYRIGAGVVSVVYFVVLMYLSSLVGLAPGANLDFSGSFATLLPLLAVAVEPILHVSHAVDTGWRFAWASPGWGPIIGYVGHVLYLKIVPFLVIGYAGLAYLVYDAVLDTTKSMVAGAFGLVSCVGCTWPIAASLLSGFVGGTSGAGSAIFSFSYGLSTIVFLVAVALLYWRPYSKSAAYSR